MRRQASAASSRPIRTVTLDTPRTAGTLNFNNAGASYTIDGSALTLQVTSGSAALNVFAGSHTIAADVTLASDANVDTASGTSLAVNGLVSGSGGITKTSAGTLVLGNSANSTPATRTSTAACFRSARPGRWATAQPWAWTAGPSRPPPTWTSPSPSSSAAAGGPSTPIRATSPSAARSPAPAA
jgi:hypothetical protein